MQKRSMVYSFLLAMLLIAGCSKSTIVGPVNSASGAGQMLMKITRDNIPTGVVTLTATLSRTGYDTLTSTLNVLTDTTSQISFPTVAAGTWNVKIDAKNANGVVLYTGTASVNVAVGYTTQLSVTLNPVLTTGGVQISILWGTVLQPSWKDYPANPIITAGSASYETGGIMQPTILYENGTYKMWFSSLGNNGVCVVSYATSSDGLTWTRYSTPVLTPGTGNAWDNSSTAIGPVIKVDDTYRMYYNGWSSRNGNWSIGLATSTDGITWTKYPQPVLSSTASGTEYQIGANDIVKINNKYYLYYGVINIGASYGICVAISDDGITWTRYSGNPIFTPTQTWEEGGVSNNSIISDGSSLKMVYMNNTGSGFGFATSTDGLSWTKDNTNPFFTPSKTANAWASKIVYPRIVNFNNELRIYYGGSVASQLTIGVLRKI